MQKEIRLKYRWIKQRRKEVLTFLEQEYAVEKDITSRANIENDLGITGDDAYELIQKFEQHFHTDMSNLNFTAYFHNESEVGNFVPIFFTLILIKIFLLPFAIIALPFSFSGFKEMILYNPFTALKAAPGAGKKSLTVGDLITSSFTHKFTLQKEVIIKLV